MKEIGTMLATIGAIFEIIFIILSFLQISLDFLNNLNLTIQSTFTTGPIMTLVFAIILLLVSRGSVNLTEYLVLGLTIIILAVLIGGLGGLLAMIGGVIVILSALSEN